MAKIHSIHQRGRGHLIHHNGRWYKMPAGMKGGSIEKIIHAIKHGWHNRHHIKDAITNVVQHASEKVENELEKHRALARKILSKL